MSASGARKASASALALSESTLRSAASRAASFAAASPGLAALAAALAALGAATLLARLLARARERAQAAQAAASDGVFALLVDNGSLRVASIASLRALAAAVEAQLAAGAAGGAGGAGGAGAGRRKARVRVVGTSARISDRAPRGAALDAAGGARDLTVAAAAARLYAEEGARRLVVLPAFVGPSETIADFVPAELGALRGADGAPLRGLRLATARPAVVAEDAADDAVTSTRPWLRAFAQRARQARRRGSRRGARRAALRAAPRCAPRWRMVSSSSPCATTALLRRRSQECATLVASHMARCSRGAEGKGKYADN